jgi:tetratricopeptide (TPR) repeat protein
VAALAAILDAQGKDAEAEALYRRALAIFERLYGPDHYERAVNSNNLAALLHARGEYAEAEQLYQRALAIKENLLGPEHPDMAMTLSNLGPAAIISIAHCVIALVSGVFLGLVSSPKGPASRRITRLMDRAAGRQPVLVPH